MKRVILAPAAVPAAALAELKQWLGITTARDDAVLGSLLAAAFEACEAFTGLMPLAAQCEERLPARTGWQSLATRPVTAITAVDALSAAGTRNLLATAAYEIEVDAEGTGRVRLIDAREASALAVRFDAGLAPAWSGLPEGLRHGIVRLAAHQHREREGAGASALPPASVAALWRPWRRLRVA